MATLWYLFRKPQAGYFSIEKIFSDIALALEDRINIKKLYVPHSKVSLWNVLRNIRAIRKAKGDIYHVTGDAHYLVLGLPGKKTLLTVHDCIFMHQSVGIKRLVVKYLFLKWPVKHCSVVTTISEKSRRDVMQYTGCAPDKVVVIPNPLDHRFYYSKKEFNSQCPVILFIGSTPNKNLARVIEAVKGINCVLDIVGTIPDELKNNLEQNKIKFRQAAGLSSEELVSKYTECDIVLFPSTYEGFGLPIIEAQQTGRPVITSNISPMNEVAADGACLVDPYSIESIREGVIKIIEDNLYREDIVAKGLINVKLYKRERIADMYLKLYQRLS